MVEQNKATGWGTTWVTPEPASDGFYIELVTSEIRKNGLDPVGHVKALLEKDPNNTALQSLRRAQKHKARKQYLDNIRTKLYKKKGKNLSERQVHRLEIEESRLEAAQVFTNRSNTIKF